MWAFSFATRDGGHFFSARAKWAKWAASRAREHETRLSRTKTLRVLARVGALSITALPSGSTGQSRSNQWKNRNESTAPGCQRRRKRGEEPGCDGSVLRGMVRALGCDSDDSACSEINQAQTAPQPLLWFALWHSFPRTTSRIIGFCFPHTHHAPPTHALALSLLTPDETRRDHPHFASSNHLFSLLLLHPHRKWNHRQSYTTTAPTIYSLLLYCLQLPTTTSSWIDWVLLLRDLCGGLGGRRKLGTSSCCFRTFQVSRFGLGL